MVFTKTTNKKFERTNILTAYYNDVKRYDGEYAENDQCDLLKVIKSKYSTDEQKEKAIEKLICMNQRYVISIVRVYADDSNVLDLINEGNIGMMEAIANYDVSKNVKFMTFASYYIKRAINLYLVNNENSVRKSNAQKLRYHEKKARSVLLQELQREPSEQEVMDYINDHSNANIKKTSDLTSVRYFTIVPSDQYLNGDENFGGICDSRDFENETCSYNGYEASADNEEIKNILFKLFKRLNEKELKIIKMYYGIGYPDSFTAEDICDELNIDIVDFSKIKSGILTKLRKEKNRVRDRELC